MMQEKHRGKQQRKLDVHSLILMIIGLVFAVLSFVMIVTVEASALILIPSVMAATVGAMNLTKLEAPRE